MSITGTESHSVRWKDEDKSSGSRYIDQSQRRGYRGASSHTIAEIAPDNKISKTSDSIDEVSEEKNLSSIDMKMNRHTDEEIKEFLRQRSV